MTRAALALGRFDASAAWRFHPFVWVLAAQFAVFAVIRGADRWPGAMGALRQRTQTLIWVNIAALVTVWALRYATGALPLATG